MKQDTFNSTLMVDGRATGCQVMVAMRFGTRLRGLLFRPPLELPQALLIQPCNSVHTFCMGYALDVVFLDRAGLVLKLSTGLKPWRGTTAWAAHSVLELAAGGATQWGILPGCYLGFEAASPKRWIQK